MSRTDRYLRAASGQERGRTRNFAFRIPEHWLSRWAVALFAVLFIVSLFNLASYGIDHVRAKRASEELRAVYRADEPSGTPLPTRPVQQSTTPPASCTPTAAPEVTAPPTPTPDISVKPPARLAPVRYPDNYYASVSPRFQKLRRQNRDIVGWLTIDGLIDEAVVQRDNEYYLDRDHRGYHNVNGAIFLDEACSLSTRPYTLILYGHNMKTGAMFGGLRNYENLTYYRNNPFITFDTAYEEGRYVIVAVGSISTRPDSGRYVDFFHLCSSTIRYREEALRALLRRSVFSTEIGVAADDQLLVLVTCVENDEERRVVVARRIRPGETEEALQRLVRRTRLK